MKNRSRVIASLAVGAALGLSLTACSTATPAENTSSACDAYASFVDAVSVAKVTLDESSSLEEIATARDSVKSAYSELSSAMETVTADRRAALEDAWTGFDDAVTGIDKDSTVSEAAAMLKDNVAEIESAQQGLEEDLSCEA